MQRNIALNNLQPIVEAAVYDWGESVPSEVPTKPDVVLAADCVYFEPAFPLLQQTMRDLIGENTTCYFCFKRRRRADLQFVKTARKVFDVVEVEEDPDREVYSRERIYLLVQQMFVESQQSISDLHLQVQNHQKKMTGVGCQGCDLTRLDVPVPDGRNGVEDC